MKKNLERARDWAFTKVRSGQEPPWAWYQYMKLIEASEAILDGFDGAKTESSRRSARRGKRHLRLVDATYPRDTGKFPPPKKGPRLPM